MVPDQLRQHFWEYDPERLSIEDSRPTVLLQEGGMDAVQWLRQNASDDELRSLPIRRRGRGISPRRYASGD